MLYRVSVYVVTCWRAHGFVRTCMCVVGPLGSVTFSYSEVSPLSCEMTLPCEPHGTQASYLPSALQRWLRCFLSLDFHRDSMFISVIVGLFEARTLLKWKYLVF